MKNKNTKNLITAVTTIGSILILISIYYILNVSNDKNTKGNTENQKENLITKNYENVDQKSIIDIIKTDANILDVRTSAEYETGHVKSSINIDWSNQEYFKTEIAKLDKNESYIVYCKSGNRSSQAAQFLINNGFTKVYNVIGGTNSGILSNNNIEKAINDTAIIKDLRFIIEEEKLAKDVYTYFYNKYNSKIFFNIKASESKHIEIIKNILTKYNIADPSLAKAGEFSNTELQNLYNEFVEQGSDINKALIIGKSIEEKDILDLETAIKNLNPKNSSFTAEDLTTISEAYSNLKSGSENHLSAFKRNISKYN